MCWILMKNSLCSSYTSKVINYLQTRQTNANSGSKSIHNNILQIKSRMYRKIPTPNWIRND